MSPRAAARLEAMGFTRVFDYVGGKKAWLSAGLPVEGEKAGEPRSGDRVRRDPPTCAPTDTIADLGERHDIANWGFAVVVDEERVVHGLLSHQAITSSIGDSTVDEAMTLGPTTVRANRSLGSALDTMDDLGSDFLLVTSEFGELLGVLDRSDLERGEESG